MAAIVHIAGVKSLDDGKVGIQQLLLHFADFIIGIILMGGDAGMLLEQLGEMGFARQLPLPLRQVAFPASGFLCILWPSISSLPR